MARQITASDAKNNFGGLLEDVAAYGRVDITKHGRVVAVVLAPRLVQASARATHDEATQHMIPPQRARAARMVRPPKGFDDDA